MRFLLIALFASRKRVLLLSDLPALCATAQRSRRIAALLCIVMFALMLATVLFYHAISFALVPIIILTTFVGFVLSAMLASRLGRLCSTEKDVEHQRNIDYLCATHPKCLDYYHQIKSSGRPFTRLDLDEMEAIFRRGQ